jgi:RHS repeat-associated protein
VGQTSYYRYDGAGQRYYARTGSQVRRTVRGAGGEALGVFDGSGALVHWNLSGGLGRVEPSGEIYYYLRDHLGSVRAVVEASTGRTVEARDYYAHGLEMPGRVYVSGSKTKEGYTGHELDAETGLNYAGARYYDPAIVRWLSTDPMKEFATPYSYVGGDPMGRTDPTGMLSEPLAVRPDGAGGIIIEDGDTFADLLKYFNYDWDRAEGVWNSLGNVSRDELGREVAIGEERVHVRTLVAIDLSNGLISGPDLLMPQGALIKGSIAFGSISMARRLSILGRIQGLGRERLLSIVRHPGLRDAIENLYRGTDTYPGGSAGALRWERRHPGQYVGGKSHEKKVTDRLNQVVGLIRSGELNGPDLDIARAIAEDLKSALNFR